MSVHNGAQFLDASIESILRQTYTDFEFLVVNDGSTDDSARCLEAFAKRDDRVRIISQENLGLTLALIRVCQEARGELIARQDVDDLSHPQRLADQIALLERDTTLGLVSCWADYVGPRGEHLETVTRPAESREATRRLLDERLGPPAHGSVMFRKAVYEAVGGYRREFYYAQDSDLWLRMAEVARVAYVQEVRYQFHRGVSTISAAHRHLQREFGRIGQACRAARKNGNSECPFLEQATQIAEAILAAKARGEYLPGDGSETAYLIGSQLARRGDRRACRYLWNVIRRKPWHLRAWGRLFQTIIHRSKYGSTSNA